MLHRRVLALAVIALVGIPSAEVAAQGSSLGLYERFIADKNLTAGQAQTLKKDGTVDGTVPTDASIKNLLGASELAVFGETSVAPTIMTATRFQKRDYLVFAGGLLVGTPITEADSLNDGTNLFVDAASKIGLGLWGAWRPKSKGRVSNDLALVGGITYAVKSLVLDDESESLDTGVIRAAFGGEVTLVADQLTIYLTANVLSVQQNVAEFEQRFGSGAPRTFWYGEYGLKALLPKEKLFLDLSIVSTNNDMRTVMGTKDGIIPIARIGFSHDFL